MTNTKSKKKISKYTNILNKRTKILILVLVLFVASQWLMVRLVYSHKISGAPARVLASMYSLKAGVIEDNGEKIDISLKDFFDNIEFAGKLLKAQAATDERFSTLSVENKEISDLVWGKLLKQAWLNKIAEENDLELTSEDVEYYVTIMGGWDNVKQIIDNQNISIEDYQYYMIEPDMLEAKVYNYLLFNFADQKGVAKIQEAYTALEIEGGSNWDHVVDQYGEDTRLSGNSFWLAEDELVYSYAAIEELEPGDFSKIVQVSNGYVIWRLEAISEIEGETMREVTGLFVYAQGIDDFFDAYLNTVNVKRTY